jgi:hypothetical protein
MINLKWPTLNLESNCTSEIIIIIIIIIIKIIIILKIIIMTTKILTEILIKYFGVLFHVSFSVSRVRRLRSNLYINCLFSSYLSPTYCST